MRALPVVAAVLLAGMPVTAQAYSLRVINHASQGVAALNVFPLDQDGEPIEDNLGGFIDVLPAGQSSTVVINAQCGPTLAVVMLADEAELRLELDTCKHNQILVRD